VSAAHLVPPLRGRATILKAMIGLLLLASHASAGVWMAPLFTDHAVLQRGKPVPVWGKADPGEKIAVTFLGQKLETTTGADRRWSVTLAAMEANARGSDLVVRGNDVLAFHDVVVGEVWLASGQSNMEMTVHYPGYPQFRVLNSAAETAAGDYPLIREFKVAKNAGPRPNDIVCESWQRCAPDTVGLFSATGYFFAREIHRVLQVPVGIINSTYGATSVEPWMSRIDLASDPAFAVVHERWDRVLDDYPRRWREYETWAGVRDRAAGGDVAGAAPLKRPPALRPPSEAFGPDTPGALFEGMIAPLIPYGLRGCLWYQGEGNVTRAGEYHALFSAMIQGWRRSFGQGDLPFFWVQLASFAPGGDGAGRTWPRLREAQDRTLALPMTGQAVTTDIGDPKVIHPPNKQEVGRRLALLAEARVYGIDVACAGPVFTAAVPASGALQVRFSGVHGRLAAAHGALRGFEVAGADRQFHPASARIEGTSVIVQAPEVGAPVAVRYAWRNDPDATLTDDSRLPAAPFRSDSW
jgi:sialate O-acetylesterase